MPALEPGNLQTIQEVIEFLTTELDLDQAIVDELHLAIDDFTLSTVNYNYVMDPPSHQFTLGCEIDISNTDEGEEEGEEEEGEEEEAPPPLTAEILLEMEDDTVSPKRTYGGTLEVPLANETGELVDALTFDLFLQTKQRQGQVEGSKLIVGKLSEGKDASLGQLIAGLASGMSDSVPEELLDEFHLGANVIFVIDSQPKSSGVTGPASTRNNRKMLFTIGFGGNISFADLPLLADLAPPEFLASSFALEFILSFQRFDQKSLQIINGFIEEIGLPLVIKPPSTKDNYLERGANIGAHFDISGYIKAWLVSLTRPKTSGSGNNSGSSGQRALVPTGVGNHYLLASPRTTSEEDEDSPITITENGVWLTIQKSFGPVKLEKVGLVYRRGEIHLTPHFIIEVSRLILSLNGLSISSPLTEFKPHFNLDGFGLELISKSLEIAGAFLVDYVDGEEVNYKNYTGTATVGLKFGTGGAKSLSLSAIGAFADYDNSGEFALFLYLAANFPFGGPPFFFVTGISAGFGYNELLSVPPLEGIQEFPFVQQVLGESDLSMDPSDTESIITDQLEALDTYIQPTVGAGFGAAGLKFTCFKIVDGFGLVTFDIGPGDFELNLIGIATLALPTTIKSDTIHPLAMAEVAMQLTFDPLDGELTLRGQLTENSYIFSPNCHLTGGYAYGLWFAGERAGDFVISKGGYHPEFNLDGHYPEVPRIGFDWQIDEKAFATGQTYFALCGHGVMAGGNLAIGYHLGDIWADFTVGANFLIGWAPFHYDAEFHTRVRAGIGSLSVGLGVQIRFWGPNFGCKFKIRIIIVTVTIAFGDQSSVYPEAISWDEFDEQFLPEDKNEVCSIAAVDGLTKEVVRENGELKEEIWVINPTTFEITTDSVIPSKQLHVDGEMVNESSPDFGISPMGVVDEELTTTHAVEIKQGGTSVKEKFRFEPITKLSPTAAWGLPEVIGDNHIKPPAVDAEQFIENTCFGLRIRPAEPPKPGETHAILSERLKYETECQEKSYSWQTLEQFVADSSLTTEDSKRTKIQDTISENSARNDLLKALGFAETDVRVDPKIADSFIIAPAVK